MEQSISQHSSNSLRGFRVQAPLVDSVSCYCKVDSGLKRVAEARKFVPGSKLCIQPDINPNAHTIPRAEHRKLCIVCKRWYRLLAGNFFYSLRKSLGMAEEWLFGGKDRQRSSMRRVIFYSDRTNKWHRAPDRLRKRHLFGSCLINNCLYVAGGECEGIYKTLRSAEVYDPNKNRCSFVQDMSTVMVPFIGIVYDGK
ncbi:F-box/kelch-repeat protein [Hibiscus syriacus]|uniref:F-box/kelch-repeat protein n=1 Tax=Hibiscus syriacus TaxID=106335 RepID=A0A6A2Y0H4_HIBSY|nr:F-box/kelch-repeat protein [Hibiscus syriacus]